jgi:hypothetical protein
LEGDYNVRIEERGLEDIRDLGTNSIEDEREFEAVARLSQVNNWLYETYMQPWVRAFVTPQTVSTVLAMQPLRLQYSIFSDKNPLMRGVAPLAEKARAERKPAAPDNPFLGIQEQVSDMMTASLQVLGEVRDKTVEAFFHAIFGSPWIQGLLGVTCDNGRPRPKPGISPDQEAALAANTEELRTTMTVGGPLEAGVRALLYIFGGQHSIDARTFEVLRRTMKAYPDITLAHFKTVVREQWARLVIDEKSAVRALPKLLPAEAQARRALYDQINSICTAAGELEEEAVRRLEEMKILFERGACAHASEPTQPECQSTRT